jgi:hypothetical protein
MLGEATNRSGESIDLICARARLNSVSELADKIRRWAPLHCADEPLHEILAGETVDNSFQSLSDSLDFIWFHFTHVDTPSVRTNRGLNEEQAKVLAFPWSKR